VLVEISFFKCLVVVFFFSRICILHTPFTRPDDATGGGGTHARSIVVHLFSSSVVVVVVVVVVRERESPEP
jgi:hypothetical protein